MINITPIKTNLNSDIKHLELITKNNKIKLDGFIKNYNTYNIYFTNKPYCNFELNDEVFSPSYSLGYVKNIENDLILNKKISTSSFYNLVNSLVSFETDGTNICNNIIKLFKIKEIKIEIVN